MRRGRFSSRLRKSSTDEGIVQFIEDHDVFDRLDSGIAAVVADRSDLDRALEAALYEGDTAQLNVRIPPAMKATLSKLARQRATDAATLARIWLAERLRIELHRAGGR